MKTLSQRMPYVEENRDVAAAPSASKIAASSSVRSFAEDIRAVLIPERKWHYLFHVLVMVVASAYWWGSLLKLTEASWAEIIMYRPAGDNEVFPVITALSQLNFGDPTDALHYGEGTAASQVVILFPYALAYGLFGGPGYMVADVVLIWMYFLALTVLFRRCNFGNFSSLLVSAALATKSLQILCSKLGTSVDVFLSLFLTGTWEWGFPDLLDMQLVSGRIPRPIVTGIFVVILLYFLVRQWQERTLPSFRRGVAVGGLLALLLQGDPFSLSALGLLLLWVLGWTVAANSWRFPWRFAGGTMVGALIFGSYFLWQRFHEHPDSAVRFGLADYPRDQILFLPGYGPLVRVGVICLLAMLVILAARRLRKAKSGELPLEHSETKKNGRKHMKVAGKTSFALTPPNHQVSIERSIATFCVALVVAGWLAQPVQLLLLGKGCQIYHYLIFTLPSLYSYAAVILFFNFVKLTAPPELEQLARRFGQQPQWTGGIMLSLVFVMEAFVGMENKVTTVSSLASARQEINVPWANSGDQYRPSFRALEKEFKENPALKGVRSFATFCYEVNFLLTAFHDKRAYLPDNAYSTLSDDELEQRLLETFKIVQLPQDGFAPFIQMNFMLNYWLGCAKYWMTSDYQYAPRSDYPDELWAELQQQDKQTPWMLRLPNSELQRLSEKYAATLARESDRQVHPDAIIVGLEKTVGLIPNPEWYREVYSNELFSVYVKNSESHSQGHPEVPSPQELPGQLEQPAPPDSQQQLEPPAPTH